MKSLQVQSQITGGHLNIQMAGAIDEEAKMPSFNYNSFSEITIDLEQVKSINSLGMRAWMKWIEDLSQCNSKITFRNLPTAIVFQCNMIQGFLPEKARVDSVYLPFYCQSCDRETYSRVDLRSEVDFSSNPPKIKGLLNRKCDQKQCELIFDYPIERFLNLLKKSSFS